MDVLRSAAMRSTSSLPSVGLDCSICTTLEAANFANASNCAFGNDAFRPAADETLAPAVEADGLAALAGEGERAGTWGAGLLAPLCCPETAGLWADATT